MESDNVSLLDIVIIIFMIFGALLGMMRGFTRQLVSLVGIFVIIILSFILKNPISVLLYNNLPFFNFGGIFKDVTVLNILLYEAIAFIIVFAVLLIAFRVLINITKIFEKILTITIVLGIPSKILGAILGVVEAIVYTFIALYILSLPMFNSKFVQDSKLSNVILTKTPVLHIVCDKSVKVFDEIVALKEEYKDTDNMKDFNQKALNIMIENSVITKENAEELIQSGKLKNVEIN